MIDILHSETFLQPQIDFLLHLQAIRTSTNNLFTPFFLHLTELGDSFLLFAISSLFFWGINKVHGKFLLSAISYSFLANGLFKTFVSIYRPWILSSEIKPVAAAIKSASGYSFPSGHSCCAMSLFGSLAYLLKNKFLTTFLFILIISIAFSRLYLGVHTPQDVIAGLVIGIFVILLNIFSTKLFNKHPRITTALNILLVIAITFFAMTKSYPMDYINGELIVDPKKAITGSFFAAGSALGIFIGLFLEETFVKFKQPKTFSAKIIYTIFGIVILYLIDTQIVNLCINHFGKYIGLIIGFFSVGIFITFIYPLIIKFSTKSNLKFLQ